MIIVDSFDEWLHFAALFLTGLRHATSDLRRVTLDSGNERMGKWVRFGPGVEGLNYDNLKITPLVSDPSFSLLMQHSQTFDVQNGKVKTYLLSCVSPPGDDCDTTNFED